MREIVARAFSESNTMTLQELQQVIDECALIPKHELTFEEKMGCNLASERLESAKTATQQIDEDIKQSERIAELETRLAALEQKGK